MKTIIVCRHAKSSWTHIGMQDFDRPLNERGNTDAPMMGLRLSQKISTINTIISSTAQRAKETTIHLAHALKFNTNNINWLQELYHAPNYIIEETIGEIDDKFDTALLVCHNPGITNWVNEQIEIITANVPTCGMYAFKANTDSWAYFVDVPKRLAFYDYPKNII